MNRTNKVVKRIDYWTQKLGMNNWRIKVFFSEERPDKIKVDTACSNWADKVNQQAEIILNPNVNIDDNIILHELFHGFLKEYEDDEERLVSALANLFLKRKGL